MSLGPTRGGRTRGDRTRGDRRWLVLVFAVGLVAALAGIAVPATYGGHVAVDEPQYLLTAVSLAEDGDLDISDELAEGRWRAFSATELPVQTQPLPDGRQISPHDIGLPLLLAPAAALGGWVGAKVAMALLAGSLAAATLWVARRRFGIPAAVAVPGVALAAASAPLAVYGQQLYPELPAALAVVAAVAVLTRRAPARPGIIRSGLTRVDLTAAGAAVTVLPWLGAKYVPVAAALAVTALVRAGGARARAGLAGGLALMGALYLLVHRLVWGGWTVYASGDHFQRSGEFGVVGFQPDYVGRGLRLVALLVDRDYGLVAWQPALLLLVPALAMLLRRRPAGWGVLFAPLLAGWLTATFVALTMHGFWWPGRQVVVVLPLALLVVLWALTCLPTRAARAALVPAVAGVAAYAHLLVDGLAGRITWVSGFEHTGAPGYRLLRGLLPDYRGQFWAGHLAWITAFAVLVIVGWRLAGRSAGPSRSRPVRVAAGRAGRTEIEERIPS
jgi:hypothetical protein